MPDIKKLLKFEIDKNDKTILYFASEDGFDISCMVDTGANVPIWFMGEEFLQLRYPSSYKTDKLTIIHGLGKMPLVDVPVWMIPCFTITDDVGETLMYHDLLIPVIKAERYSFNMLIPLTMLNRMKCTFDYKKSAQFGYFSIEADKEDFYVRPIYVTGNSKYLNRIQVFFQTEETE